MLSRKVLRQERDAYRRAFIRMGRPSKMRRRLLSKTRNAMKEARVTHAKYDDSIINGTDQLYRVYDEYTDEYIGFVRAINTSVALEMAARTFIGHSLMSVTKTE